MPEKKDNSTKQLKVELRSKLLHALSQLAEPVVLETHGGLGKLYAACYAHVPQGIVIEKNPAKAARLLEQRGDRWAVYEGDSETALKEGLGRHLPVNFLDVDPYGDPWPHIHSFFNSDRPKPKYVMVAVNDGLRQLVQRGGAWTTETLREKVTKYGNSNMNTHYLEICREMMAEADRTGRYKVLRWTAYSTGRNQLLTHYGALLGM